MFSLLKCVFIFNNAHVILSSDVNGSNDEEMATIMGECAAQNDVLSLDQLNPFAADVNSPKLNVLSNQRNHSRKLDVSVSSSHSRKRTIPGNESKIKQKVPVTLTVKIQFALSFFFFFAGIVYTIVWASMEFA